MKVSKTWLKQLVDLKIPMDELVDLLPLRTIGTKEVTNDFIELDMKGYNRADLLSMRGVALEVAAITDSRILFEDPQEANSAWKEAKLANIAVSIQDPRLCPIYCVAKIEGLKVDKSDPDWVKKLNDCGIRSVNNIADVTNLVMLEFGQPLHAFDANRVDSEEIIVRNAKKDEEIVTLDGKSRKLQTTDLLIADSKKAIGIAGVMGGQNTQVIDSTQTILLEAAIFDSISIRKTTTSLGLPSEASKRFQHGLTSQRLLEALNSAIKMYEGLGGKLTAINLVGNFEKKVKKINLYQEKLNNLIGIEIPSEKVEFYLKSLGFNLRGVGSNSWEVVVPYWRLDVNLEEDLIEEVARMYGYEKIPPKPLSGNLAKQKVNPIFETIDRLKNALVEIGLTEVQTYSFYSTAILNNLNLEKDHLIKIANPISSETEYMRHDIWPNLLEVASRNLKFIDEVAIFEIGKTYHPVKENLPNETYTLSIVLSNTDTQINELIEIFRAVNEKLNLGIKVVPGEANKYFHPTRHATLTKNVQIVGQVAEIHKRFTDMFGIQERVVVLELVLGNR